MVATARQWARRAAPGGCPVGAAAKTARGGRAALATILLLTRPREDIVDRYDAEASF